MLLLHFNFCILDGFPSVPKTSEIQKQIEAAWAEFLIIMLTYYSHFYYYFLEDLSLNRRSISTESLSELKNTSDHRKLMFYFDLYEYRFYLFNFNIIYQFIFDYLRVMLVDAYSPAALYHFTLHYFRSRYGLPPVASAHAIPKMLGPPYQDIQEDKFITKTYKLSSTSSLDKYVPPKHPAGTDLKNCPSPYQEETVFNVIEYSNPLNPVPACPVATEEPSAASSTTAPPAASSSAETAAPAPAATAPFCPPLLMQTQTRSKTIIGVEPVKGRAYNVLMFDPYSPYQADPKEDPFKILNSFRHPPSRLTSLDNIV